MQIRSPQQIQNNLAASGWNAAAPAIDACKQATQAFIADRMRRFAINIQNAALARVALIEKDPSPDAMIKLRAIEKAVPGWPAVQEAIRLAALHSKQR